MDEIKENPWKIFDFNEFLNFKCPEPECQILLKSTAKFIAHGIKFHLENFKAAYTGIGLPKTTVYLCQNCLEFDISNEKCSY